MDVELGRRALVADGLCWVVLHQRFYTEQRLARVAGLLDALAEPVHDDGEVRVYRLISEPPVTPCDGGPD